MLLVFVLTHDNAVLGEPLAALTACTTGVARLWRQYDEVEIESWSMYSRRFGERKKTSRSVSRSSSFND